MSFAGHVLDSIARMKYNRDQLAARRERYTEVKGIYTQSIISEGFHFKNDDIPKEVSDRIKSEIREEMKKKRIRSTILSLSVTLLLLAIVIFVAVRLIEN